jgi:hypothetical protein
MRLRHYRVGGWGGVCGLPPGHSCGSCECSLGAANRRPAHGCAHLASVLALRYAPTCYGHVDTPPRTTISARVGVGGVAVRSTAEVKGAGRAGARGASATGACGVFLAW